MGGYPAHWILKKEEVMQQEWICEACGVRGTCTIPRQAGVFAGLESIAKVHGTKSLPCQAVYGIKHIRVRNPGLCSAKEWRKLIREAAARRREAKGGV